MEPDFSGWASKFGVLCADGRTIQKGAFAHQDQTKVPLVWAHKHDSPTNVLGHVLLSDREEGVWVEGFFNQTKAAADSRELLKHGDVDSMSIWANQLTEANKTVIHGQIREVSLVLAGANPEAKIENVHLQHGDDTYVLEDEVIITTGEKIVHAGDEAPDSSTKTEDKSDNDSDVAAIIDSMSPEQQAAMAYVVNKITEELDIEHSDDDGDDDDDSTDDAVQHDGTEEDDSTDSAPDGDNLQHSQEGTSMTRRVFEGDATGNSSAPSISHDDLKGIIEEGKKLGSFKQALVNHLEHAGTFGINEIDELFPQAKNVQNTPEWIKRRTEWVDGIINGVTALPFSRIRSMSADITHEEARAKGYIKGNLKKDEFFAIKSRVTTPKTVYKKQKLDRDDIVDITEFDVVVWLRGEMRMMLEEEIARAILIGDGREVEDEDKISETNIRPIAKDDEFYAHQVVVKGTDADSNIAEVMEAVLRSRKHYKGSGSPAFYTTEDYLTDMLLSRDELGRRHFRTEADVAAELRVSRIVVVDVFEEDPSLIGIMVNISDYRVGTDKGGKITEFSDFDIDYNQEKYLIETRFAGALTKHKSAVVFRRSEDDAVTPGVPTETGDVITIPSTTGVDYFVGSEKVTGTYTMTEDTTVFAEAQDGYYIPAGTASEWTFTFGA